MPKDMNVWIKVVGGTATIIVSVCVIFRKQIYNMISVTGRHAAQDILEDKDIHESAHQTITALADRLIANPKTKQTVATFVNQITTDEDIQDSIKNLMYRMVTDKKTIELSTEYIVSVLNEDKTRLAVTEFIIDILKTEGIIELAKEKLMLLFNAVLDDDETVRHLRSYIVRTLDDDKIRKIVTKTGEFTLMTKELHDASVKYVTDLVNEKETKDQLTELLKDSVTTNLNDKSVQEEAQSMLTRALSSAELRANASDALYDIIKQATLPSWFSSKKVPSNE